uniref:Thioredoxin domain-containing protein 17 n=1 Tax=Aotus nancymaae TaxID=37293 RepID=A0A2K5BYQ8_AOTNA
SGFGSHRAMEQHNGKAIFASFTGSKDTGGKSWCPDCVQAEPVVREGLKHVREGCVFIYCQVGDKPYWKRGNWGSDRRVTGWPSLLPSLSPSHFSSSSCPQ